MYESSLSGGGLDSVGCESNTFHGDLWITGREYGLCGEKVRDLRELDSESPESRDPISFGLEPKGEDDI